MSAITAIQKQPTPGSREAIAKGCKCPVIDNAHGRGAYGTEGSRAIFVQRFDCPLHGATSAVNEKTDGGAR
ncbi:MAG: hypothetical protein JO353_06425 [Phycisphaerae bacterium]|nr:hypothetical protein [Phycisphaerae bacterium]